MGAKKILKDTMGVTIGAVGIREANKIDDPLAPVLGTSMTAGLVTQVSKKKKGGW